MVGQYYVDYLNGDQKHIAELKDLLERCGYASLGDRKIVCVRMNNSLN